MNEQYKNAIEKPNYKARRLGAGLVAGLVIAIPVSGNTGEAVSIPVKFAKGTASLISEANEPKGREIPNHIVKIENAHGIKGGTLYQEQGNSGSQLGSGAEG